LCLPISIFKIAKKIGVGQVSYMLKKYFLTGLAVSNPKHPTLRVMYSSG